MADIDDALNQSFIEEQTRFNSSKIKTSESDNVVKLFREVQLIKADCNVCYKDDARCIQCYQCEFNYCCECLGKIISEFGRCSACQVDYKNNYAKLKQKNKKAHAPSPPMQNNNAKNNTSTAANSNMFDMDMEMDMELSKYELEQIALICEMENLNMKNKNQSSNSGTHARNNKSGNASSDDYLDSSICDDIEPCQFQSFKPNAKYNFKVTCDRLNKLLIYTPTKCKLCPIIIYYELLDTYFQRALFIHLVELVDKSSKFVNAWQTIAAMINNFTNNFIYDMASGIKNNPDFLYQRQDLLNLIAQIVV